MVTGVSGVGGKVPGVSGLGGGVWIGPCRCCVLHHFLGFVADFLGVFCLAGVLLGRAEWHVCRCGSAGRSGAMELQ